MGLSQKSDPNRQSGRSQQPHRTMSISGPSTSAPRDVGSSSGAKISFQPTQSSGFVPRPIYQQKQASQAEMGYIQVDTSYSPHSHHQLHQDGHKAGVGGGRSNLYPAPESCMKKGVLSQLIDKVRSKDDRKKSTSSSSGGTQPVIPSASQLAARRALTMYDAQCQSLGLDSSTSAVSALALNSSLLHRGGRSSGVGASGGQEPSSGGPSSSSFSQSHNQRQESPRPSYQRAKSFVKSKSDDERSDSVASKLHYTSCAKNVSLSHLK